MTLSVVHKQNCLYLSMIVATIAIAMISYRYFEDNWIYYRVAEDKFNEKAFPEAIELYQKSLAAGPVSSKALVHLADSYVAVGNFSEAIKWYRIYLNLHPEDSNTRLSLARALSWNGNIEESQQEYQTLLKEQEYEMENHS